MARNTDNRIYRQVSGDVERVEYPCSQCQKGVYRYQEQISKITEHNQLPHACNHCGHAVYFTVPYPALRYKNRLFVDFETIRSIPQ